MEIINAEDKRFRNYGRLISEVDFTPIVEAMETMPIPENVVYEPGIELLESTSAYDKIRDICYGETDIQIGHCSGKNTLLNALEYHRSSEINVFATDAILLLGKREDIEEDNTYDTSKVVAFYFKKGMAAEIYANTLHYAPCNANPEGFKVAVVLPKGTNTELKTEHAPVAAGNSNEDSLITAVNKWLIAHPDAAGEAGHFMGLKGENIDISKN